MRRKLPKFAREIAPCCNSLKRPELLPFAPQHTFYGVFYGLSWLSVLAGV
jgi:hypothetical protein